MNSKKRKILKYPLWAGLAQIENFAVLSYYWMKIRMSCDSSWFIWGWIKTLHINGIKPVFIEERGRRGKTKLIALFTTNNQKINFWLYKLRGANNLTLMTIEDDDYASFYITGWLMGGGGGWTLCAKHVCSELPALEIAENGDDHGQMYRSLYLSLAFSLLLASTPRGMVC